MEKIKKIVCAVVPTLAIAFVVGGISGSAAAQDNTIFAVTYYSNANTTGAPDATLRVINDGSTGGGLCAAFYVFDDSQEMQECCSCPVTADGVIAESFNKYLLANSLTSVVNHKGVIKLISTNAPSGSCDPRAGTPTAGIRGWATHIQVGSSVTDGSPVASQWIVTEAPLHNSNLGASDISFVTTELAELQLFCWYEIALGMGHGICACGQEDQAF